MKEEHSLLNVIIPVYNASRYLERCLEHVIAQSYVNTEIIIIDDGSDDGSSEICKFFANKDNRIRLIQQENQGSVVSRKRGLDQAKGDYIVFVDADDWIEEKAFEEMIHEIEKADFDFVAFGYYQNDVCFKYKEDKEYVLGEDKGRIIKELFWDYNGTERITRHNIWSKIYRQDFITECFRLLPNEVQLGEDMLCYTHCLLRAKSFAIRTGAYYHHNVVEGSLSHTSNIITISDYTKLHDAIADIYRDYGIYEELKKENEAFCLKNINRVMAEYMGIQPGVPLWQFPHREKLHGKSVFIYGAGNVGRDYLLMFQGDNKIKVKGVADKNKSGETLVGVEIIAPEKLKNLDKNDLVIIALKDKETAKEARSELMLLGIDKERLIWKEPKRIVNDHFYNLMVDINREASSI